MKQQPFCVLNSLLLRQHPSSIFEEKVFISKAEMTAATPHAKYLHLSGRQTKTQPVCIPGQQNIIFSSFNAGLRS